jgi:DNA-binding MarR family transcriptional regulator
VGRRPGTRSRSEFAEVELAAWRGFLRAHAELVRELDAELEAAHGLPLSSYEVLARLAHASDRRLRMSTLADSVLLTSSGISRLVDRLARAGLVVRERCPSDARGLYAVLTERGLERWLAARATHRSGVRRRFLARFSDEELRVLAGFWQRLAPTGEDRPATARRA